MPWFRRPHQPAATRRKSKPLALEPLEERLALSHAGAGLEAASIAAGPFRFSTLNSFNGANGGTPGSNLVLDTHGNVFGTTTRGGRSQHGSIFVIPVGTRDVGALTFLSTQQGNGPAGALVADAEGNLLGTASRGGQNNGGTVFQLASGTSVVTRLASLGGGANGSSPASGLTAGGQGNLYGVTKNGGISHLGTVFVVNPAGGGVRTLASFNKSTGTHPSGAIARDAQGDLFGTTYSGGLKNRGTVWEIAAGTNAIRRLASFDGNNGSHPLGPLTIDAAGNLYGTTTDGGASGMGTVFAVGAGSSTISRLASLTSASGHKTTGGLLRDARGDLIGTAQAGGANNKGTVFLVSAGTSDVTPLVSFTGGNGARPAGSLVVDTQGNILGTTSSGGRYGKGTVFKLTPGS